MTTPTCYRDDPARGAGGQNRCADIPLTEKEETGAPTSVESSEPWQTLTWLFRGAGSAVLRAAEAAWESA